MTGMIERTVREVFSAEVEASDPEEAQDMLYEVLAEYPNSSFDVDRLLKVSEIGSRPTTIAIELDGTATERVFDGELDDDSA